jgi:hypothetical protein
MSIRVRMVYLFGLCVVLMWSSRFTASALVWFYNFLKYLVFHWALCQFLDLHWSCGCLCTEVHSEWSGGSWIESTGGFRCWNWRLSPIAEFHRSIWVWVLLCIESFLLIVLIFFWVASAFVSLLSWAVFFYVHINLHITGYVMWHGPFLSSG